MLQELEDELKKMKLELKQITEKYNAACHESVIAREKVNKGTTLLNYYGHIPEYLDDAIQRMN